MERQRLAHNELPEEWVKENIRINELKERVVEGLKSYFLRYREIASLTPVSWVENPQNAKHIANFFIELLENIGRLAEEKEFAAVVDFRDFGSKYTLRGYPVKVRSQTREILESINLLFYLPFLEENFKKKVWNFIMAHLEDYKRWYYTDAVSIVDKYTPEIVTDETFRDKFSKEVKDLLSGAIPDPPWFRGSIIWLLEEDALRNYETLREIPINADKLDRLRFELGMSFVEKCPKMDLKLLDWRGGAPREISVPAIPIRCNGTYYDILVKGKEMVEHSVDFVVSGWFGCSYFRLVSFCTGNGKAKEVYEELPRLFEHDPADIMDTAREKINTYIKPYISFWLRNYLADEPRVSALKEAVEGSLRGYLDVGGTNEGWGVLFAFLHRMRGTRRWFSGDDILDTIEEALTHSQQLREKVEKLGAAHQEVLTYIKMEVIPYLEKIITLFHRTGDVISALLPSPLESRVWVKTAEEGIAMWEEHRQDFAKFIELGRAWIFGRKGVPERSVSLFPAGWTPRRTYTSEDIRYYRELAGLGRETLEALGVPREKLDLYGIRKRVKRIVRTLLRKALRRLLGRATSF